MQCLRRVSVSSAAGALLLSRCLAGEYKFFEDMYPKHPPAPRFETFEDQMKSFTVRCEEKKKEMTESEWLNFVHDNWKKEKDGFTPPEQYAWHEDWGPAPGQDGHNEWYKKNRMYMSNDERAKFDIRQGVPVGKNNVRHQEMPYEQRMKAAYANLQERGDPQFGDLRQRNYWSKYSYEDQRDTIAEARDNYMREWLEKPGVTKQNVAKEIANYNGTGKQQRIKQVERRPEWELPPHVDNDDD